MRLKEKGKELLLAIFNNIWMSGEIPEQWRRYMVIFIDKANKEKVRHISLSSCIGKIMERIVNYRLAWWMENKEIVDNIQMSFGKGKGCLENLLKIILDIKNNNKENKITTAAFLDVTGAYDNVNYSIMIRMLDKLSCPEKIRNFIRNWMEYRNIDFVRKDQEIIRRKVCKKLPQGAVLSPNLYSIYTFEITKGIPEEVQILQFADDIGLYVCTDSEDRNRMLIEYSIKVVRKNLEEIGLDLETAKIKIIEFRDRGRKKNKKCRKIKINEKQMDIEHKVKFLGVWLDEFLNFKTQIEEVDNKEKRALNLLKFTCGIYWGIETNTAMMLYKSYMRSTIEYGLGIWYPGGFKERLKLERLQYAGVRRAWGYKCSTPTNVMITESKVMNLKDRALYLIINLLCKNIIYGNNNIKEKLEKLEKNVCLNNRGQEESIITKGWKFIKEKIKDFIEFKGKYEAFKINYWANTDQVNCEIEIGEKRQGNEINDELMTKMIREKYKITDNYVCIPTQHEVDY